MAIRVLITDDHGVVRQGLRMYLGLDPELEVVGEAANGEEALRMARELGPDVVLMDLLMPVMDGIAATGMIRTELPDVEVIALTSVLEDASVSGAVRAGAIGYLLRYSADDLGARSSRRGRHALAPRRRPPVREFRYPKVRAPHRARDGGRRRGAGQGEQQISHALFTGIDGQGHVSSILANSAPSPHSLPSRRAHRL